MSAPRRSLLVLAVFCLTLASPLQAQHASVRVQVIDRGQADGILIRTPNEKWVVIDAGTNAQQANAMENVWGVDTVALVVTSHRHGDHYGGMPPILRRFPVKLYIANLDDCPNRSTDDTIRGVLDERSIPARPPDPDTLDIDGVRFIVLPPDPVDDQCPGEENNNSVVVRMEFGSFSMLFTGDSETAQREWLMEHHPELLDVDVLKASHHGSRNGADGSVNGRSWMDFVDAEAVVISVHIESRHDHPHPEAMTAYEAAVGENRIYCTSRHGTVRVYGRPNGSFRIFRQSDNEGSCRFGTPLEG